MRVTDTTYTTDLSASLLSTDVLNIVNGGSNAAPIDKGINFYNANSSLRAHIGCSDSLALYSSNQIVLRPGAAENNSGEGIALSKTQLLPKNSTIDLGGTSNYWKTAYLNDIYLSSTTASSAVITDANKKLISRAIDDRTSNGALGTSTGLTTERSVYYGLVTVNGASQTRATGIYAPTSAGTANFTVISSGSGAPSWQKLMDLVYPIGSIYISTDDTNPGSGTSPKFPGTTWEAFAKGKMLVGYDNTSGSSFGTGGATGGREKMALSDTNIPSHQHTIPDMQTSEVGNHQHKGWHRYTTDGGSAGLLVGQGDGSVTSNNIVQGAGAHSHTISGYVTGATGSGAEFNIMNPYVVVYMWKRTA